MFFITDSINGILSEPEWSHRLQSCYAENVSMWAYIHHFRKTQQRRDSIPFPLHWGMCLIPHIVFKFAIFKRLNFLQQLFPCLLLFLHVFVFLNVSCLWVHICLFVCLWRSNVVLPCFPFYILCQGVSLNPGLYTPGHSNCLACFGDLFCMITDGCHTLLVCAGALPAETFLQSLTFF